MTSNNIPILTVNSRLARWLLFRQHKANQAAGRQVWKTPEILDLASWLRDRWIESWPDQYILADLQSRRLWEEIIRDDPRCRENAPTKGIRKPWTLLHHRTAARQAAKAYALIREYRLSINTDSLLTSRETHLFLDWSKKYEKRLLQLGALDPSVLMDKVREGMGEGRIPVPAAIELAGFEEFTPQMQDWSDFLQSRKVNIHLNPDPRTPPRHWEELQRGRKVRVAAFPDRRSEVVACARWLRAIYQPGKSIGIVVPDLENYRYTLNHELKAELAPASVYPWEEGELPFNISLGNPLSDEAMAQTVLQWFGAFGEPVPLNRFLYVLKSPFLNIETSAAEKLELDLIKSSATGVYLEPLETRAAKEDIPSLNEFLKTWRSLIGDKYRRLPSQWARLFSENLDRLGWPTGNRPSQETRSENLDSVKEPVKNRSLTSRESQCLKTWKECLDAFASLDHLLGKLGRVEAAEELSAIAMETPFHIKTREQPIQIVGLLESAQMEFDHLWVMGCTSDVLPAVPNPNPFLPAALQRKLSLPHADPNRELAFAENSVRRLLTASSDTLFSHPLREDDRELKMSPLLSNLSPDSTEIETSASHRIKDLFAKERLLETITDPERLSVNEREKHLFAHEGHRSGFRVLQDQAECPFRAFAAHRLNAETLELPELDFGPSHRGIFVHKVLEIFWKRTGDQKTLINLKSQNRLASTVAQCVNKALDDLHVDLTGQAQFAAIEKERTVNLILQWLEEELRRPEFTVDHKEKKETVEIAGLKLSLRPDRVDTVQNGSKLLIDYKTGAVRPIDWFGERIREPQLPLYASQLNPDGIAFACVRKGDTKWRSLTDKNKNLIGLGKPPQNIPEASGWPDWQNVLNYWKKNLEKLAGQFLEGQLTIDPLKAESCRNCRFKPLCRIGEPALENNAEEEL